LPDLQNEIELAAIEFARAVEAMEVSLVNAIADMSKQGLTRNEIYLALSALNMEEFVLTNMGFAADIDNLMIKYETGILANMQMYGSVTEPMLQSMVSIDKATFLKRAGYQANLIKQELSRKVLAGASETAMLKALKTVVQPHQAKTLVNTTLNTFSRTVNAEMAQGLPADQKFIYEGAIDDRTRDICLEMASAGQLTKAELESSYPGTLIDGGGYNCRHRWVAVEAASSELLNRSGAKQRIDTKQEQGKWQTPQTPLEQLGG
jgi:hypothetical protein|tara:strand:- start:497 stop:1285 length:789 start_codon:yes stop_codon:yes gene_type:complete